MRFHLLLEDIYEQYKFFLLRKTCKHLLDKTHFKFSTELFIFDVSAQSVVFNFSSVPAVAGTTTLSLSTHGTLDFIGDFALCVTCAVESTCRSDDPEGRRHPQFGIHTSSRRADKQLTSNFNHDEGKKTTAFDCLRDKFEDQVM